MKTEWDYTNLADAYLKRPEYSAVAINAMLSIIEAKKNSKFCDIGAGVAHLTLELARREFEVLAVEPNDAMRANGIIRTEKFKNINWHEGTGENTGQPDKSFRVVTFGSSFNVCDRKKALIETARILEPGGWFVCMWNHRQLTDPIQGKIEEIIKSNVKGYGYGTRREDQSSIINESGHFGPVIHINSSVIHKQSVKECVEAWRSHATLKRQAKDSFTQVIYEIEKYLNNLGLENIKIPYLTNIWLAQLK